MNRPSEGAESFRRLEEHRLGRDSVSTEASSSISVGDLDVLAISDGFYLMDPTLIGTPEQPSAAHDELSRAIGEVRLPVGAFLVPGEQNVLIDLGVGPVVVDRRGTMIGGNLLHQLERRGFRPEDIDVLAFSHLHHDHIGWFGDARGKPIFPNARVFIGRADWEYFVEHDGDGDLVDDQPTRLLPHIKAALDAAASAGLVELVDGEQEIVPGVRSLPAPGHTPGHSLHAVYDGKQRLLLLGDAMHCPQQMTHPDWEMAADVDPRLARKTREHYLRDIERHGGSMLGCHFPGLRAGRALVLGDD